MYGLAVEQFSLGAAVGVSAAEPQVVPHILRQFLQVGMFV